MYKTKLCAFAIACMVGFVGVTPITAFATETDTESVTLSEKSENRNEKGSALEAKMKKANEKWNTLTVSQKGEVYSLFEKEMQAQIQVIDKLVALNVMEKADAAYLKAQMQEKFSKMKANGDLPILRHRGKKNCK